MHFPDRIQLRRLVAGASAIVLTAVAFASHAVEPPRVLDPDWQIELIASEPELVTPVGCCFDNSGRLLVVECHTHFPPDDYSGPKVDRIYMFDDTRDDGVVDRRRLFYEGGTATMGVVALDDGWIAVARRSEVVRIRDRNNDGTADESELLLTLKTEETYPHDALAGLVLGPDGLLYVGQGENLGAAYELIASDGSKQVGGGEGGNIFRCQTDGSELERVATGFWNPFALYFDPADRLWTVGNDPDAMPPCRLLHVAAGGDYGFQFRFGRAGTHPLQAWNGEFPGTLPMVAGTGEAPGAVVGHGQHLWVTSWGDNRIERYKLEPKGASWSSETEVVVQGDASFRPVGMAVAADGSIYITDWVDRSYPVHGKGRLWRLSRKPDAPPINQRLPDPNEFEKQSLRLLSDPSISASVRFEALNDDDPFLRQSARAGLVDRDQLPSIDRPESSTPRQRVGLISAWRWKELSDSKSVTAQQRNEWIVWGLGDESDLVVLAAIRWATERGDTEHLPAIRSLLDQPDLSSEVFAAVIASIAYLETGSAASGKRDPARERMLYEFASDTSRSARLRALAIRMIPPESDQPADQQLRGWLTEPSKPKIDARAFALEVVRLLSARATKPALQELSSIAADDSLSVQTRADAIAGLARNAGEYSSVLNKLGLPRQPEVLRQEARRVLKRTSQNERQARPNKNDLDAWNELVGSGGDPDAGRRVFFRTTCVNCHAHSGRGATTGPDLTTLSGQMTGKRLLESILEPSKEVGPLYVPWRVLTVDGNVLTGLKLDASGVGNSLRFQGADGMTFDVPLGDIEAQDPVAQSIMPAGLEDAMSIDELRDLIAFLVGSR